MVILLEKCFEAPLGGEDSNSTLKIKKLLPGVTKVPCFLEALKYLKTSKQHPFETPGGMETFGFLFLPGLA